MLVWGVAFLASLILGTLTYIEAHLTDKRGWVYGFMNIFRHTVGYFIALVIVYYFIQIRWNEVTHGGTPTVSDLMLLLIFIVSVMGWLPFYVKSTHDKMNSLAGRIFK